MVRGFPGAGIAKLDRGRGPDRPGDIGKALRLPGPARTRRTSPPETCRGESPGARVLNDDLDLPLAGGPDPEEDAIAVGTGALGRRPAHLGAFLKIRTVRGGRSRASDCGCRFQPIGDGASPPMLQAAAAVNRGVAIEDLLPAPAPRNS